MFKKIILKIIRIYQQTISFDHGRLAGLFPGGYCRFRPTCSQYTYQAINKYGPFRGMAMGAFRILRCNPWSRGGWDPVE